MDKSNASQIDKVKESELLDSGEKGSHGISYRTIGSTLQALAVQLDENEVIYSESGKMAWMSSNVVMKTKGQSIGKIVSRMFASESIFLNEFKATNGTGIVTFATEKVGKIIPVDITPDKPGIIFQRGSYLCSEIGVERNTILANKISAGLFGGKGFILQKLTGKGKAHLISDGEVVMYELKQGEVLLVDQGNLIAYEDTVDYDIRTVQGGVTNWLFGGEGIFHGSLTGPGRVWLQSRKVSLTGAINAASYGYGNNRTNSAQNPLGCIIGLIISALVFGCIIFTAVISSFGA